MLKMIIVKSLFMPECLQEIKKMIYKSRLYGLRKYKKQIKEDQEIAEELQNRTKSDTGTKIQD